MLASRWSSCSRCLSRLSMLRSLGAESSTPARMRRPIISEDTGEATSTSTAAGAPAGFKATPGSGWVFAHTIAHDVPHALNAAFSLDRFTSGALIDEHGAAAVAH